MNHHHYHLNKNTNSLVRMLLAAVFTGILMGGDHHRSFLATTMAFSATTTTTNLLHTINTHQSSSSFSLYGYLDNLSRDELYDTRGDPNPDGNESREDTQMSKDQLDRYGPGDLSSFVDFGDEFDGGDGRRYFCILFLGILLLLCMCVVLVWITRITNSPCRAFLISISLIVVSIRWVLLRTAFFNFFDTHYLIPINYDSYNISNNNHLEMGVAGDGKKGLDKEWAGGAEMAKSKSMSAKNAWGKATGYADELIAQGVDTSKAQQLENWKNQREVQEQRNYQKYMTEEFDNQKDDENWRMLSKFGGELVQQDVDLDQELGAVQPGQQLTGVIELTSRLNQAAVHEFSIKNPFMGFSDYRARFTYMTNPADWSISPTDGSLNGRGSPQDFIVKFRPQSPTVSEGFLVIETEEDKWTYKLIGTASM